LLSLAVSRSSIILLTLTATLAVYPLDESGCIPKQLTPSRYPEWSERGVLILGAGRNQADEVLRIFDESLTNVAGGADLATARHDAASPVPR
jgi:hypothetical protein